MELRLELELHSELQLLALTLIRVPVLTITDKKFNATQNKQNELLTYLMTP